MSLRIIGVDPGSRRTGWGVIEARSGEPEYLAHGVIAPPPDEAISARLHSIYLGLQQVASEYRPTEAAVESVFMSRNAASALKLGQARGAALVALGGAEVQCFEYAPGSIKSALVGRGRAEKEQVQHMASQILGLKQKLPEDAADALSAALCHLFQRTAQERIGEAMRRQ